MTEESEELPFPNATVVRMIRENLGEDRMIRKRVKVEMNKWLGEMCEKVSKRMNESPYTYVDYETFKEATKMYKDMEELKKEKKRIIANLEKIKEDCDSLIRDLERKLNDSE